MLKEKISQLKNAISGAVTKEGLFPEKLNDLNNETLTIEELNLKQRKLIYYNSKN